MIIIDDAPIYNPSHMLGMFSTIIPDAINDMTLYKGDMPASMGGRLSSVLDIRTKKGNDQHLAAWGDLGLLSTKLGVEGPVRKDASSFLVSTRFSRLKWLASAANLNVEKFNFYDFTGKMNFKVNQSNRIFLFFYHGADNFVGQNNGLRWSNTAGTLRWNHLFSERLFMNTTMLASGYDYFLYRDARNGTGWHSHISNFNLKSDFNYYISPGNEISFGTGITAYGFNPGNLEGPANIPDRLALSVRNSSELVLYGSHDLQITDRLNVSYGLRLSAWSNSGEAFEFRFDEARNVIDTLYFEKGDSYKTYVNAEPRLTIAYEATDATSVKANLSRNVQNIHLITNSISPFTSLEVWLPSSFNIRPQRATQTTVGVYHHFNNLSATLSVEGYLKRLSNQIEFEPHAETILNPLIERELRFGNGLNYGIELLAKKDIGRIRGWAGYTYARAKRTFDEVNDGVQYNSFYDRPHQVSIMGSYDLTKRWNVGFTWVYSTGSPYSAPTGYYYHNGEEVPVYGAKNNVRLPDYHRLDVGATHVLNKNPDSKFKHSLNFSIYNFYARENSLFVNYNKIQNSEGDFKVAENLLDPNRVTSNFFLFRFAPSLSYSFKWR
jgi:hypothetical protein